MFTFIIGGSATAFFSRIMDNKLKRIRNGELPFITEQDCHDQKGLLPMVLHTELEDTPFALDHGDLSAQNILVDSEHNVTG